ncbi:MAG: NTP transferase domain-containing protein [Muribaculaceae bacterium]|nr:NTP transferase domain-containing protein [Muribaculaceae bacterium]
MKAMIFAAGLGSRLKPFTDLHPKALAEIGGKPILGRVIEKLKSYGINEIVVNVHHFANQIIDYINKNNNFGIEIHISDETDKLLDTGGGILAARRWLDGKDLFLVHNADILTDFDIHEMYDFAVERNAWATLLVAERSTRRYLMFEPDNFRMKGWINIESGEVRPETITQYEALPRRAFGGVHIVSSDIFPELQRFADKMDDSAIPKFSIMDFYISRCADLKIFGFEPTEQYRWHDIGKPESLMAANADFTSI